MTTHEPDEGITLDDFDFDTWLEAGTVATRTVEIHNDPALLGEYEALEAELEQAEKDWARSGGDQTLDAIDPRPAIVARLEALWERWEAAKATWTVRALSGDEVDDSFEPDKGGIPVPPQPVPPLDKAGQKAREDYARKFTRWAKDNEQAKRERRLVLISWAVTRIEARGRVSKRTAGAPPIVTVEQLRAMRARPHGEQWIIRLHKGIEDAMESDRDVPRPTSPVRSTSDED